MEKEEKTLKEIKKQIVNKILEKYGDELEEDYTENKGKLKQEYSYHSAQEHSYTEKQIEQRKTAYANRRIKELKKKRIRKYVNDIISSCFGLVDNSWNWQEKYKMDENDSDQIEEFLFAMASLRFQEDRLIYHDKIETNRKIRNKYIFRDLKKGSLEMDYTHFCDYILNKSKRYVPINNDMLVYMKNSKTRFVERLVEGTWRSELDVGTWIDFLKEHYLGSNLCMYSIVELYTAITYCEELVSLLLRDYYLCNKSEDAYGKLNKFLHNCVDNIDKMNVSAIGGNEVPGNDIFSDYAWRLLYQTTEKEGEIRSEIYRILAGNSDEKEVPDFEMDESKQERIRDLLEWYHKNNMAVYSPDTLSRVNSKELYYEIYIDKKTTYKDQSAEKIANRILRNEYYKNYNLAEEILFLQYKIRRGLLRNNGTNYRHFFNINYLINELSRLIWGMSKQNNYDVGMLFDLWRIVIKEWKCY